MNAQAEDTNDPCRRRCFIAADKKALYRICQQTGDAGKDATHIFHDVDLLGDLYVGPYLEFEPELAWTIEDGRGVCGYVLAVSDTVAYQKWHLRNWLPKIRKGRHFPKSPEEDWTMDDALRASLFEFEFDRPEWLEQFPSHIHIDLLPRIQGKGWGSRYAQDMLDTLCQKGSVGVHLGMHPENLQALSFYQKLGFQVLEQVELRWEEVLYLGKYLQ